MAGISTLPSAGRGRSAGRRLEDEAEVLIRRKRASSSGSRSPVGWPATLYTPRLGRSRHPRMFIKVDLPEPDAPRIEATISPASMRRFTPLSTATVPSPDGNSATGPGLQARRAGLCPWTCGGHVASEHPWHARGTGAGARPIGAAFTHHHLLAGLQAFEHLGLHTLFRPILTLRVLTFWSLPSPPAPAPRRCRPCDRVVPGPSPESPRPDRPG